MAVNTANSGAMSVNSPNYLGMISNEPTGDTWRGLGSDWFNGYEVAKEDWEREQQAAQNQMYRDLYVFEQQKAFSREQMSWEERMSNTAYQRAVEDMKKAGINPVMAVSQGGASTPSSSSVHASRSSSSNRGSSNNPNTTGFLASILSLVAGIYGAGAKSASAIAAAEIASNAKKYAADTGYIRDVKWRNYYDKKK